MNKFYAVLMLFAVFIFSAPAQETSGNNQNKLKILIKNEETKQPVSGAKVSIRETQISAVTNSGGQIELNNIPNGEQIIEVQAENFEIQELRLTFPLADQSEKEIFLKVNEVGEVLISTTRTGREIENNPTRVEAIDEEEVDEKSSMRSANVSMILSESTGIKVQQTSATSYTQSIRIQGLDGRYTQILKDGFPAFGGFSGSLSLLDIPPLDLKQVEIIKGPAATYYGAGAIAGVVNFISKEPTDKPVTSMIFNQTSALGTDFSIFNTRKFASVGYTFLGSVNYQKEYDVDDDNFTELPNTKSFGINPRLFFNLDDKTRLTIGNSTTYQNRKGGDVFVIRGKPDNQHQYFENNYSVRNITTFNLERQFENGRYLLAKQSLAFFERKIEILGYNFDGRQFNSYTDITYFHPVKNHALVFGFNAVYDRFREKQNIVSANRRDETRTTIGGYVQDSFDVTDKFSIEAGFRLDAVKDYGVFALPRVSLLFKFTENLSSRLTFGLGYKTPSIFTEEAETRLFENVLPIGNTLKAERSFGGTFDVNYRNTIGEKFAYSINQMFFYTEIDDPLVLLPNTGSTFKFSNAAQPVKTSGFETNVRASYDIVKLFAGYTFTNAKAGYLAGNQILPLTPKSKINSALLFEKEENFKAGLEAYYTSSQFLSNRFRTRAYWVVGIFGEKNFGKFSLFINAENITDTRHSRFGQVVFPPFNNPTFAEIYTHTEGRVFNGGIKIRL
jgi:iron complex outermembrane receptor protein/outer membrane receptor for ferrienterochelin and colicins